MQLIDGSSAAQMLEIGLLDDLASFLLNRMPVFEEHPIG